MNGNFESGQKKVFDFMQQLEADASMKSEEERFKNSIEYKQRVLDKCQDEAKNVCLDAIFAKLYKDATPLSDDYKVAQGEDLDVDCKDFFAKQAPKGMEYYVRSMAESGNQTAKRLIAGVERIVAEAYRERSYKIESYSAEDMEFRVTDDIDEQLDVLSKDLSFDDLATVIQDNVKRTVTSEISRAKEEKEKNKQIEADLANDLNVTSESAIDYALELHGMRNGSIYTPSLFEGMMIGFEHKYQTECAAGNTPIINTYGSLELFSEDGHAPVIAPNAMYAFMESVKELTKLNILQALQFDKNLTRKDYRNELAQTYSMM